MNGETILKSFIAGVGAIATYFLGGWTALLDVLFVLVAVDYASGMIASATAGKLSSKVGFLGITKKIFIFLIIAVAYKIGGVLGMAEMLRDGAIYFYIVNELLSIIENSGKFGMPLPPRLLQMVDVLKGKGEGK